jgi:hypothetical protein
MNDGRSSLTGDREANTHRYGPRRITLEAQIITSLEKLGAVDLRRPVKAWDRERHGRAAGFRDPGRASSGG